MLKKNYLLIALLLLSLTSCRFYGVRGSGNMDEETREVDQFSKIEISGAYEVEIIVGEENKIEISAEDNLLPLIKTKVRRHTLIIENRKSISPREDIIIKVYTESLKSIETSGASTIYANGIDAESFNLDFSGAGSVYLEGDCSELFVNMSGAGSLNAKKLVSNNVRIIISGASSAKVYASESLFAEVSGVGSIDYYGDPEDVDSDVSGVGSINRK